VDSKFVVGTASGVSNLRTILRGWVKEQHSLIYFLGKCFMHTKSAVVSSIPVALIHSWSLSAVYKMYIMIKLTEKIVYNSFDLSFLSEKYECCIKFTEGT
jgi:hypothetical protein